jgi:hypothetical protein
MDMNFPKMSPGDLPIGELALSALYIDQHAAALQSPAPPAGAEAQIYTEENRNSCLPIGELALSALDIGTRARTLQPAHRRARFG